MIKTKNKKLIPFCMMTMLILTGCEDFMNNFQKKDDNDPPTVKIKVENPNPTISKSF